MGDWSNSDDAGPALPATGRRCSTAFALDWARPLATAASVGDARRRHRQPAVVDVTTVPHGRCASRSNHPAPAGRRHLRIPLMDAEQGMLGHHQSHIRRDGARAGPRSRRRGRRDAAGPTELHRDRDGDADPELQSSTIIGPTPLSLPGPALWTEP